MVSPASAALIAGVVSALVSLAAFLGVHHLWIKPIWHIALPGSLIAVLGGLAVGWAYLHLSAGHLAPGLLRGTWRAIATFAIMVGVLTPGALLSLTHGPLFDLATATIPEGRGMAVAARFFLELVVTAALTGAALGWWVGGTQTSALAGAAAALALALGPGHNVPMFGAHPSALKGFAIVVILSAVAAPALVGTEAWLAKR